MASLKLVARLLLGCSLIFSLTSLASAQEKVLDQKNSKKGDGPLVFALDLFKTLQAPAENVLFSPLSVSMALTMTASGSRGDTAKQLKKVLHLSDSADHDYRLLQESFASSNSSAADNGPQMLLANRVWLQEGGEYQAEFKNNLKTNYFVDLESLDFRGQAEASRVKINDWVASQTREKIKDLLPAGSVAPGTEMVLVNALYFKGEWLNSFAKKATHDEEFQTESEAKVQRPLMHQENHFQYAENEDFQALTLPFRRNDYAMVIWLPKEGKHLQDLMAKLDLNLWQSTQKQMSRNLVDVSLPIFKMDFRKNMNSVLQGLGMRDAFDSGIADFSGIRDWKKDRRLFISLVMHKAFMEVNEDGVEAAAATAVVMMKAMANFPSRPQVKKVFKANRPFLLFVEHVPTQTILFIGKVASP